LPRRRLLPGRLQSSSVLPTQSEGRQTAAESLHANQSGRDVLEHHLRCNPTQLIEDKVICYVQRFVLQIPQAGLHFAAWLRCKADFSVVMRFGYETGVRPVPLSFYCMQAKLKPAFVFGFAAWSAAQIREGLTKFASVLNENRRKYWATKQSYLYISPCGYVANGGSNPAE
jgi:hypothetical protein